MSTLQENCQVVQQYAKRCKNGVEAAATIKAITGVTWNIQRKYVSDVL